MRMLTQYRPDHELRSLHDEVSRLFDGFAGLRPATPTSPGAQWLPPVDVRETSDAYVFQLDLPGVDPKDVKLEMTGDTLSVRGEKKSETVSDEKDLVHRVERISGTFERSFRLGLPTDASKVKAAYRHGVLEIRVPKLEQAKKREITIDLG